ncbi:PLP-dependent aminotransferase family protein [Actinoplanes sp. NEAU-A12]|uniref:PLP-dependent aminotransferase family protein n=1 Tax=Actinoplanes sandaracinus TaxID=3045177 RepID=A0ABT6X1K9_9ACTN|nr:PLP-dependent aminotransferase family protein [Actinoplanes sandaracinus]MDI6105784.1 PLP-dependent aminotransferase family protein [Actinoplanes sandaracinus]
MPGSDFLLLRPEDAPAKGLTGWLAVGLRSAIAAGRLVPGSRLPATRLLAAELAVSRGVVVQAYQRLVDEGLAEARTGSGTVVTGRGVEQAARPAGDRRRTLDELRLPLSTPDGVDLDLSPGVPDLSAFPRSAWLRAERAVLDRVTAADLGYGDPGGAPRLRAEVVAWLARTRGVRCEADDVVVTAGVAQGLALLAHVLRGRGTEAVAVEDPGSRGAGDQLAFWGMRQAAVPVDEHGMRITELAATGVCAAVLTPAHQFPTGVVLSPERRRELLGWADAGGLVIEDDYDAEHRYDRAPVAAFQGSAPDRVAYLGSVSKSLAPAMRMGWLIAPRGMQAELLAAKHASDLGNPALPQLVLAELLASGDHERHLRAVRTRQRSRRDALLAGLRAHLPEARVAGVAAGLHVLVLLPGTADDVLLAGRIAAAGVLVQPLTWHRRRPGPPGLVIGYAAHPPDRLAEAARRIGRALSPPGGP